MKHQKSRSRYVPAERKVMGNHSPFNPLTPLPNAGTIKPLPPFTKIGGGVEACSPH